MLGGVDRHRQRPPGPAQGAPRRQRQDLAADPRRGPGGLGQPVPGAVGRAGIGRLGMQHEGAHGRVGVGPVLNPFQPAVPPAQRFVQKPDGGPRHGGVRILVHPGPDDALDRNLQVFKQMAHGVHVIVGPAADRQHRHLNRSPVLAHRAVTPIAVARLMPGPARGQKGIGFQPRQPIRAPALAQHRIGGARGIRQHHRPPTEVPAQETPTLEMDVIGKAVGGRTHGDDRLQRGRAQRGGLQAVEAAPAFAHHPDRARTPWLGCQPGDHLAGVGQFLGCVFVGQQPRAVAAAAQIDPHAGIAMPRHVGVHHLVARQGAVALAVGDVFQHRRHRMGAGIRWHPDPRRQPTPVGQNDTQIRGLGDRVGKIGHGAHRTLRVAGLDLRGRGWNRRYGRVRETLAQSRHMR